jgi:hypothetical protein
MWGLQVQSAGRVYGSGFSTEDLEFRMKDLGLRAQMVGLKIQGLNFRV